MRANLLTSPRQAWGVNTLAIGHDRARNGYMDELTLLLSEEEVESERQLAGAAKAGRELSSYRFPAAGAPGIGGFFVYRDEAERFARMAGELALLNSLLLCEAVEERFADVHGWSGHTVEGGLVEMVWDHAVQGVDGTEVTYFDEDDYSNVGRIVKKVHKPMPFIYLIGEGGIEDFFGALSSTVDDEHAFDPDDHWDRILELP